MCPAGLVIIGAGGFGREILTWARQSIQFERDWVIRGFIDDKISALSGKQTPARILGPVADYEPEPSDVFICAIGIPRLKRQCCEQLIRRGARFTKLIHRTAIIGDSVELDDGVVMCPFSVASANNRLGFSCALNLHATVDHDAVVGDWTQINSHCDLTAGVRIGSEVFLGSGVSVVPGVEIADGAYIGAGAVVTRNIPKGAKAFGVPARVVGLVHDYH